MADTDAIASWLIGWFRRNSSGTAALSDAEMLDADYFADQYIDSFAVIMLIGEAEAEFDFRFTEDAFQDRRFPRITGLAEIIAELKA